MNALYGERRSSSAKTRSSAHLRDFRDIVHSPHQVHITVQVLSTISPLEAHFESCHAPSSHCRFLTQSTQPIMDAVPISKKLIAFGSKKIYL